MSKKTRERVYLDSFYDRFLRRPLSLLVSLPA